ncbi:uncharacterized protein FIBRA_02442 [Fibroporia radiculosa]|uniref:Spo11/DNA topoisomerase VI subunit A N-terminal domain-containing protein n=1 Tax=Fibroporia radiculosa TaxID=599839 RepID=J4HUY7_9APHY|nr:uncharacterized protein FIBRA_02442 [Fibroporia radiculosa]CCM00412.1 predicted protein [Fibroporia radiculosa]
MFVDASIDTLLDFDSEVEEFAPEYSQTATFDKSRPSTDSVTPEEDEDGTNATKEATQPLEALVLSFMSQLSEALVVSKRATRSNKSKNVVIELVNRRRISSNGTPAVRVLRYPQRTRGSSAKSIAQLFKVMDLAHNAIAEAVPITKRDIYYHDVKLFKSQAVVDKLIEDLAATFDIRRGDLFIRASSKGLVSGSQLRIHLKHGDTASTSDTEV